MQPRLQTTLGVGAFSALLLQAGPIARFACAQELAAYAGLGPGTHCSGGKNQHGHVGRGSPWLEWIVVESRQTLKLAPGPVVPR